MQIIIILAISDFTFSTLWKKYELFITDLIFTPEVFINESILITKRKSREIKWMAEKVYNQLLNFHSVGSLVIGFSWGFLVIGSSLGTSLGSSSEPSVMASYLGCPAIGSSLRSFLSPLFPVCPFFLHLWNCTNKRLLPDDTHRMS